MRPRDGLPIDVANPIDRTHWAAQGLSLCLRSVPGLAGGARLHDLCSLPGDMARGNHGTRAGTSLPAWSAGTNRPGGTGHMTFDGSGRLDVAHSPEIDNWADFAISAWFRSPNGMGQFARLLEKGTNNELTIVFNYVAGSGKLTMQDPGTTTNNLTSTAVLCDNQWHHVVCTRGGDLKLRLYVDGVRDVVELITGALPGTRTNNLRVGAGGGTDPSFIGDIDDVRFYRKLLSTAAVRDLYALSLQGDRGLINRVGTRAFVSSRPVASPAILMASL
jgi:hypothetical protein